MSPARAPAATRPPAAARPANAAPGRMTVVGRVLDPQGKPVPNASVMVYGALKQADDGPGANRTRTARPGGLRRLGPVSARHAADLVGHALHDRRRGPRAGIRHGLGRPGHRRRSARRRHHAPARAGDRGPHVRHQGASRAGRPRRGRGDGSSPARSGSLLPRVHRRSPPLGRGLREDPAGLAGARGHRRRGPLHHPRRRPRPARPPHGR